MRALILHQFGKKSQLLERRLRYENIYCDAIHLQTKDHNRLNELILSKLIEVNALIFYVRSPDNRIPLSLLPELARKVRMPIIVLDEKEDIETKTFAKTNGADFYINQPFSIPNIAMKLKYLTYRKKNLNGADLLKAGNVTLDLNNHIVARNGSVISLRNKEFALLEFFMLNRGKILTRNTILEHVWDRNTSVLSNTVDVHIARLRRKLGDEENNTKPMIRTIYCVGYCFEAGDTMVAHVKQN